jgi:hypothetical protein
MTLTAKIRLLPTEKQIKLLKETSDAYKQGCNYVSYFRRQNKMK